MSLRLIDKYGQLVTWRQLENGTPADVAKPWVPGASVPTDHTGIKVAFVTDKDQDKESSRFSRATAGSSTLSDVHTGNVVGLMGNVSFVPTIKDVVLRGSEVLRIHSIETIEPNSEGALLYKIKFQR